MRFLILVLPLICAHVDNDFTIAQIEKNLDFSVEPCDDFYRHVCPSTLSRKQLWSRKMMMWLTTAISDYYPDSLKNVLTSFQTESSRERIEVSEKEVETELMKRCLVNSTSFHQLYSRILPVQTKTNCWFSVRHLIGTLNASEQTQPLEYEVYECEVALRDNVTLTAWNNYIRDEKNNFAEKEKAAKDMFVTVKETMLNLLLKSPWVKKHNLTNRIRNILESMSFYSFKRNPKVDEAYVEFERSYNECTEKRITGFFRVEHELCLLVTASSLWGRMYSAYDKEEREMAEAGAMLNAHWWPSPRDPSEVAMYPAYYGILEIEDEMSQLAIFGYTLAHEVGHGIFKRFPRTVAPTDYDCVAREMEQTCELFAKNMSCHSGYDTLQEDAADLAARRITLIMAKEIASKTQTLNMTANRTKISPENMIYYGVSSRWCDHWGTNSPGDVHSSYIVRVNGVLRLSEDFRQAFHCKAGDAMVMEEDDLCHLLGEKATR